MFLRRESEDRHMKLGTSWRKINFTFMIKIERTAASYCMTMNSTGFHHTEEDFFTVLKVYATTKFGGNFY